MSGFQEPAVFDVYQCNDCNAAFCDPLSTDPVIYDLIYREPGVVAGYERYVRYGRDVLRTRSPLRYLAESEDVYWGIERLLRDLRLERSALRVLDVGCGLGYLTYALRAAGYEAVGIDLSSEAIATARARFGGDYRTASLTEFAEQGERFDAVVMAETIEHVADPTAIVRDGTAVLERGGRLIITTPNRSAFGPDVVWTGDLPPIHLWWLSEESLRVIARAVDCEIEFVDYSEYNATHPAPILAGSCRPHAGEPGLDKDGRPKATTTKGQAKERLIRSTMHAAHAVGVGTLARRVFSKALRLTAGEWATGPRRMTLAASLMPRK